MMTEHWENLNALTAPLLTWYDLNGRTLPWRSVVTPYRTWVSEIMLQQTRVGAVIPYFARFMDELPDVSALAAVSEERLFKLWEGLGYYSRARNLQRAAKLVVSGFGGALPQTYSALLTLPGIGAYTAAAIASINFGEPVAAVDGNLLRVAAHARAMCEAYKNGLTEVLPVRARKKARRIEERTVLLLFQNGRVALRKRADTGLLAGLWEFPNVPESLDEAGALLALARLGLSAPSAEAAGRAKHIFTHIEWDMQGYLADVSGENTDLFWADAAAFDALALPTAFKKYTALVRARL